MRKILAFFASILTLFIFTSKAAFAQDSYIIEDFKSDITINRDTSVTVAETIRAKFRYDKHGIIRVLPGIYSHGGRSINSHLSIDKITDENGIDYLYTSERLNQSIRLKIGDPAKTITGNHVYKISYKLKGVILEYDGIPEFYWNVTGHEWDTQIMNASVIVKTEYAKPTDTICYTGLPDSGDSDCEKLTYGDHVDFSTLEINPGADFSFAVKFDTNNSLIFPSSSQRLSSSAFDNWGYIPSVIPLFLIIYIWYKKGRDEKYVGDNYYYKPDNPKTETVTIFKRGHIPLVYHPLDGLSPAQVGTILDERIDINDIVAEIVELARLKFIKIEKLPKKNVLSKQDYAITKLNKDDAKLTDYQKEIIKELFRNQIQSDSIFELAKLIENPTDEEKELKKTVGADYVTLSSLKNHFYAALPNIKKKVYKSLAEAELFDGSPDTVRIKYIGLFIFLSFVFGFLTLIYSIYYYNFVPLFLFIMGSVFGIFFAMAMPKKTAWGYSMYKQVRGLREYLEVGKWRHENYEKNMFFEEMIPLAISLGVINKLAGDMNELGIQPPRYMSGFTIAHFASDMSSFRSTAASTFASVPGGSGHSSWGGGSGFSGGGSGGGFGGGGGGSW